MALTFKSPNYKTPIKKTNETQGEKYRIYQIFDKTIELDELSIPGEKSSEKRKAEDTISLEFPLIKINDYVFNRDEIRSISIDCTDFIPKIRLDLGLLSQLFIAKEMPKDGDIISIAIRSSSDVLKIVRNDYIITGVHTMPNYTEAKSPVLMTLYGELFIPGLRGQDKSFSFNGTSFEALQDFAKKYGLGFTTNEDNTDDKQIWLKVGESGMHYINRITQRAWKDKNSFYRTWIDVYYNLNFINVNKQLMSAESEVDIAVLVNNVDKNWFYGADTEEEKSSPTVKVFSNFPSFRTSPFFVTSWRPFNRSSNITFAIGTKTICSLFEHNQKIYSNPEATKYWEIPVEPTYDPEKTNKYIILRGRASYVDDEENTDLKRVNYDYIDLYKRIPWLGVQYTISNPDDDNLQWDGNQHKNYHLSKVKNLINNKELDKLNVHIEVNGKNFNIIRGDKVPLALIRMDAVENYKINPDTNFGDALDLFYSGWYYVKGFKLYWTSKNEGSTLSNFTHEFILTRREWPPPIPVEPIKLKENAEK